MMRWLAPILALTVSPALAAPELCGATAADALRLASPEAQGTVVVVPEPAPLKVGQQFSLQVVLCGAATGANVVDVDARMPAHGHGMNYKADISAADTDDVFRADGMLLHMPGQWQVTVDAEQNGKRARYSADVMVKP